jgi:ABC-type dipeptide/oligopeptide/nickel transport system permease component
MRRLTFGAVTIIGVSIIVFMVLRILPGDPLVAIFGPEGFTKLSEAERAHFMAELGLSDPLVVQYLSWVGDIARGNFGRSFFRSESVGEMILRRGPLTAEIGIMAVILSWLVGIPVAIVSALRPNSLGDNVSRFISIVFLISLTSKERRTRPHIARACGRRDAGLNSIAARPAEGVGVLAPLSRSILLSDIRISHRKHD